MKKLVKIVSSLAVVASFAGMGAQVASAKTVNFPLSAAEDVSSTSAIKKGNMIFVVVKDTKKQTVPVYTKNAKKTRRTVKMGSEFKAQATRKSHGKKLVKVSGNRWLNVKDVVKE